MAVPTVFIQLSRSQRTTLFANATLNQKQAPLITQPVWTLDNALLATLRPSQDGMTCDVLAKGPTGIVNVTSAAVGQAPVEVTTQITIITDYADTLTISYGSIVPQ